MTAWVVFACAFTALGLVTGGWPGAFGALGCSLVLLPFWWLATLILSVPDEDWEPYVPEVVVVRAAP